MSGSLAGGTQSRNGVWQGCGICRHGQQAQITTVVGPRHYAGPRRSSPIKPAPPVTRTADPCPDGGGKHLPQSGAQATGVIHVVKAGTHCAGGLPLGEERYRQTCTHDIKLMNKIQRSRPSDTRPISSFLYVDR